jgi:hypothetical protein
MAMSLKDHSGTGVNATTFIHTSNAHLQGPGGSHGMRLVASQSTVAGKACAPPGSPMKQSATTQQDLCYSGRDPLARRGTCRRESLAASLCCS